MSDALQDALREMREGAKEIDLKWNNIGVEGARALAEALKTNSSLQRLDLSRNNIGAEGARALAEALKTNSSLQTLSLAGNKIGVEGARALAEALEVNIGLEQLSVDERAVPEDVLAAIESRVTLVREQKQDFTQNAASALAGDRRVRWGRAKLMLVGHSAAGKTSLVRSLLNETPVETHDSTQGADLTQTRARDWERLRADASDLPEQLAKRVYARQSLRKSLSKRASQLLKSKPKQAPAMVEVKDEEVAKAYSAPLRANVQRRGSEVSREVTFTIWDYGGQEVFYALHHLFLTRYGVSIVVFDMTTAFESTVDFWLDSIKLHAPETKVLLVGTRLDVVGREGLQEVDTRLQRALQVQKNTQLVRNKQARLCFFPIDNMDRSDATCINAIRNAVIEAVRGADFTERRVPLRWTLTLDRMLSQSGRSHWPLSEVLELAEERCGVSADEARNEMLPYMHELGVVVHFGSAPSAAMRELVVTRPQWLLDMLSRVICERRHMRAYRDTLQDDLPSELRPDMAVWEEDFVVSRALLEWLWGAQNNVDFLLDLMQEMLLASAFDAAGTRFLVPSLLPSATSEEQQEQLAEFEGGVLCWFDFDFLPRGVFARFVCAFEREFEGDRYNEHGLLRADLSRLSLEGAQVLLVADHASRRVELRFMSSEPRVYSSVKLLFDLFRGVSERFMRGRLGLRLQLSADGSHDAKSCVDYGDFLNAAKTGRSDVPALARAKVVPLAALQVFARPAGIVAPPQSTMTERGWDAFVSYCHMPAKHKALVRDLVLKLRSEHGLRVWHDQDKECIAEGEDVQTAMANGIRDSAVFVVAVSRVYADRVNLADGGNLHREFMQGASKRPVVPVVLDASMRAYAERPEGVFTFKLGDPLYTDIVDGVSTQAVERVAQGIKAHLK